MLYRLQRNNAVNMQDINLERIVNLKLIYQEEEKTGIYEEPKIRKQSQWQSQLQ